MPIFNYANKSKNVLSFDDAKVNTKKIPTQRKSELGMTLGKWDWYWERRPSKLF